LDILYIKEFNSRYYIVYVFIYSA